MVAARPQFHLFLPQLRMTVDSLVERARAAEAAGFDGIALMDHLVPPGSPRLVEHFGALRDRGVEHFYTWFTDFAPPETLAAFGSDVIGALT